MSVRDKLLNSTIGDTFAIKIDSDERFLGKYLILIRFVNDEYEEEYNNQPYENEYPALTFYAKITENEKLPKTKEELDSLEFIKVALVEWGYRYLPLPVGMTYEETAKMREDTVFYPDEYNYLYSYCYYLLVEDNSKFDMIEYLGNFKIKEPEDQYVYFSLFSNNGGYANQIESTLIDAYKQNNLRESHLFQKKYRGKKDHWQDYTEKLKDIDNRGNNENLINKIKKILANGFCNPSIYSSEVASKVKDVYIKLYDNSYSNDINMSIIYNAIHNILISDEDENIAWIVLANEQVKQKRLDNYLKGKAIKAIDKEIEESKDYLLYNLKKINFTLLKKKIERAKNVSSYNLNKDYYEWKYEINNNISIICYDDKYINILQDDTFIKPNNYVLEFCYDDENVVIKYCDRSFITDKDMIDKVDDDNIFYDVISMKNKISPTELSKNELDSLDINFDKMSKWIKTSTKPEYAKKGSGE